MSEKRRDKKGRILRTGEGQRKDLKTCKNGKAGNRENTRKNRLIKGYERYANGRFVIFLNIRK